MRKFIALLALLFAMPASAVESPCYWAGTVVKCLPSTGIHLDNLKTLRLGTNNDTNYVELVAPSGMSANKTLTLPDTSPGNGQVLYSTDTLGTLSWEDPGVSQANVLSILQQNNTSTMADLVCAANTSLTGTQTCDGQSTSGAGVILAIAQTDPTENGLWAVDDFSAWTRTNSGTSVPGHVFTVKAQGGGTSYQNTVWLGTGDDSTPTFLLVPTSGIATNLTASLPVITSATGRLTTESALSAARGGTGVANNAAATLTRSGNHALTLTTTNTTSLTLPTSGTVTALGSDIDLASAEVTGVLTMNKGGSNKNATAVNGGLVYSDADSFEITSAGTSQNWVLSGGAGAPTMSNTTTTGKMVDGSADEIQLTVQGHSTQTSDILVAEKSDGTDLLEVTNTEGTKIKGTTTATTACTGCVGQVINSGQISNTVVTSNTAVTGASIVLTAGAWLIFYAIDMEVDTANAINARTLCLLEAYNSTDSTTVANSTARQGIGTSVATLLKANIPISNMAVVNISGTKTFILRGTQLDVSGTGSCTAEVGNGSTFYGLRIY
jgi:hypothetical protein